MDKLDYSPKLEAVRNAPWKEVIASVSEPSCFVYGSRFCSKVAAEDDPDTKEAWRFFARVTSFSMNLDDSNGTLGAIIDAFSDDEIELIKNLIPEIDDPELKARLCDIVWTRRRSHGFKYIKSAIEAYIESARRLEISHHWSYCVDRTERALQLAFSLGGNTDIKNSVTSYIEDVITRCNGEDLYFLSARMMSFLLDRGKGDASKFAPLA